MKYSSIEAEYQRWKNKVGVGDPYSGKYTIGIHQVLEAHFLLLDYFFDVGEGVGGVGPKNIDMLHSALSRQFAEFGGIPKYSDRLDVCATLMFGLIKNHPFFDANKRTAFLVSLLHLQKIGRTPTVDAKEYEDFTVNIAESNLAHYPAWGDTDLPSPDREVFVIARFLRRHTREIDTRSKTVTFFHLRTILGRWGLGLENPSRNRIDLVKYEEAKSRSKRYKRIAHIGFHGWSKEVSKKDIARIREAAHLHARHGYDSQTFFNGLEGPLELIQRYRDPLERLAFR